MAWKPNELRVKGARGELLDRLGAIPEVWPKHVTQLNSDTKIEPFAWAGAVPQPRKLVDGRQIQGLRTFTYNIENYTYELSVLVERELWEDDQTGNIKIRMGELAEAWKLYKDYLFAQMLINGATATYTAYDGNTFFHDTRTEGDSGTIDNKTTSAAATGTIPTATEFLNAMQTIKAQMFRFKDDQGRPANNVAMTQVRVIVPPTYERAVREGLNATIIGNTTNVYGQGLAQADISPWLTADTKMYVHAVGAQRKGIIYQQRTPMELTVLSGDDWVNVNEGVLFMLRERFRFAYGDFRRMVEHAFS